MGGHGGLNILPQKRWNVYNFDNREKVRRDEEEAAREEQLEQEQARKIEAESRLERLRSRARGSDPFVQVTTTEAVTPAVAAAVPVELEGRSKSDSNHINLFEGIKIFDPVDVGGVRKREVKGEEEGSKKKKMKKEAAPRVVDPEDEKYRLGYGIAGKGVKAPWYMTKPSTKEVEEKERSSSVTRKEGKKEVGKSDGRRKTLEELREERLKRENKEKQRVQALMMDRRGVQKSTYKDRYHRR